MEEMKEVNVEVLLNERIIEDITELDELSPSERKERIENIERLHKLKIEEIKVADSLYNEEQRRKADADALEKRLEADKERLESDMQNQAKENEIKEKQLKVEKQKMWLDNGMKLLSVTVWTFVTVAVVIYEKENTIRSKAFTGTAPKLKFW